MKRRFVLAVTVVAGFLASSVALAGPGTSPAPTHSAMTGTIVKVDAKGQTVTVKPVAPSQQVQVQTDIHKKGADPQADNSQVFRVDGNTTITFRAAQPATTKGAPAPSPAPSPAPATTPAPAPAPAPAQVDARLAMLREAMLVRVVYQEEAPAPKPAKS